MAVENASTVRSHTVALAMKALKALIANWTWIIVYLVPAHMTGRALMLTTTSLVCAWKAGLVMIVQSE